MIWLRLDNTCDCLKCKGSTRLIFVDLSKVTDFVVSHDCDDYFPIYAWSGNKSPLKICVETTLESSNKKLDKIIGCITLLNANYPNLIGYYESVAQLIADCDDRIFKENRQSQELNVN